MPVNPSHLNRPVPPVNPQPWPSSAAAIDHWRSLHANQRGQPQADAAGVDLTPSAPFLTADSLATAISADASATGVDSTASPATGVASQPRASPEFYAMNSVSDVGSTAGTSMASWDVVPVMPSPASPLSLWGQSQVDAALAHSQVNAAMALGTALRRHHF